MNELRRRVMSSVTGVEEVDYVDLGLPSGALWAKGNIVSDGHGGYKIGKETDYGAYFSWGNVEPHFSSNGSTFDDGYDWGSSSTGSPYKDTPGASLTSRIIRTFSTYNAARLVASTWTIPSRLHFQELLDNTDYEWTTINGVNGTKFMKKTDHSVYVFLPAAGYGSSTSLASRGTVGSYWTTSGYSSSNAYSFQVGSSTPNIGNIGRHRGNSVRGIQPQYYDITINVNLASGSSFKERRVYLTNAFGEQSNKTFTGDSASVTFTSVPGGQCTVGIKYRTLNTTSFVVGPNSTTFSITASNPVKGTAYICTLDNDFITAANWDTKGAYKEVRGVVIVHDEIGNVRNAYMVALEEQSKMIGSPVTSPCSGTALSSGPAKSSYAQQTDSFTDIMISDFGSATNTAAGYTRSFRATMLTSCSVPTGSNMVTIANTYRTKINTCLSKVGGTLIGSNTNYWTSCYAGTSSGNTQFWYYSVSRNSVTEGDITLTYKVRPMSSHSI